MMRAMVLECRGEKLTPRELAKPKPQSGQLLIKVCACAVCRTDLHVVDGDLPDLHHPITPGHEVIGRVVGLGENAIEFQVGDRVGVPWLGHCCGVCDFCRTGQENLCKQAKFTGYSLPGGFAEMMVAEEKFCFAIPDRYDDAHAAPLMCAGLIGYRSLRMTGEAKSIGIYGFGAAAHILTQVAKFQGREIYGFTRPGDLTAQNFARQMGAVWAGDSDQPPPKLLDAAIIFAPVGALVPLALRAVRPAGIVVCGGIHMSDIPSFPYELLWEERVLRSVANLTHKDAEEFLALAAKIDIQTEVALYPLSEANAALDDLREGRLSGAAVLTVGD